MADEEYLSRARSFGSRAADYAAHRPDYPADGIRWALGGAARSVLDLAAGTGKLTDGLLPLGLEVTAVEPDEEMRAELTRRLPTVEALAGTAEAIPLAAGSVDAVLVGQAFHWFDQEAALDEIGRVLRPGGTVGLLWNGEDSSVEWMAGLLAVAGTSVGNSAPARSTMPGHPSFCPPEVAWFPHTQRRTADSLAATFATHSRMIVIAERERELVLGRIREYLSTRPETAHGEFDAPLVTKVVRAKRR
ncbi:class I SAM-dependent methyltransferase [Actinophytocola glycyrrhizae]|uniref:Class I SAM-dependent methyltransferase n=1 Tax=Actinophytocola glycyrrhizae TaxID=2044873 RepID=A0ABV9S406_9PSEU